MNKLSGGKINPLIGSAGVSAVPMAARVSQKEGQKANPANFLLMHAMGPNVAGVIGSAIAAGVLLSMFGYRYYSLHSPTPSACVFLILAYAHLEIVSAVRWKRIQRIRSGGRGVLLRL